VVPGEAHKAPIAVIIPVYNVTAFLEEAIVSVIAQDYQRKDIIVVDDGSSPEQASQIHSICNRLTNITMIRQPHIGPAAARHLGVSHTSADLVVFLDGDDIMLPGTLTHFANALWEHPEAIAAYGRLVKVDENADIISDPKPQTHCLVSGRNVLLMQLAGRFILSNGTVCIRREALERIAPKTHALKQGEDWVLWCHLALSGNIVPAGERVVLHYRRHRQNTSSAALDDPSSLFEAFETVFSDPAFICAIGVKKLNALQETLLCLIHAQLGDRYAYHSQWQKAIYHLSRGARYIKTAAVAPSGPFVLRPISLERTIKALPGLKMIT
jgi:glycosyltransferase involved in cell wall biosynthesis